MRVKVSQRRRTYHLHRRLHQKGNPAWETTLGFQEISARSIERNDPLLHLHRRRPRHSRTTNLSILNS